MQYFKFQIKSIWFETWNITDQMAIEFEIWYIKIQGLHPPSTPKIEGNKSFLFKKTASCFFRP